MIAIVQSLKTAAFVMLLGMGVILLWEIPYWEEQSIAEQKIPTVLRHQLTPLDAKTFLRHIKTRLPKYREQFEDAGTRYGLPWTLLAAQAYQESRWNRNAMSPTGVRGLMMLTRATAQELGIENRLDVKKSIMGGARYLAYLLKRIPEHIPQPDRLFMALAAYNVGLGHLKDARLLAKRLGKDPDRWKDVKTVLPLLAKKSYYQTLPHRYARGWEPVQYVKRIRDYQEILEHMARYESRRPDEL